MAAKSFVNQEIEVVNDSSGMKKVLLTKLLLWYKTDFGQTDNEVLERLSDFISDEQLKKEVKDVIANTNCHEEDFGHPAEWFFSPTGHGKNAVDGINGTLKHNARQESLRQGDRNTITSAEGFFNFMKEF